MRKKASKYSLFLLFLLPLSLLIYNEFSEINRWVDFTRKEHIGVEYNQSLIRLLKNLQHHRGMSYAYLNGAPSFKDAIAAEHSRIEDDIEAVDLINSKYGRLLKADDKWEGFKKSWKELEYNEHSVSPKEFFDSHTEIIAGIISLISYIGETSNLILDPELPTYYLMDCLTFKCPIIIESIGQARGAGIKAAITHSLNEDEKRKLIAHAGLIKASYAEASETVRKIFSANQEIKSRMEGIVNEFDADIKAFLDTLDREIINAPKITINPSDYYGIATKVMDAGFNLYDRKALALDKLLEARIHGYQKEGYLFGSILIVISSAFIYLFAAFIKKLSELEVTKDSLESQLDFENVVASISANLVNPSTPDAENVVRMALQKIGEFVGAATSYISLFSSDGTMINCLDEWYAEGVKPQKGNYIGLPVNKVPWVAAKLKNFEIVNIPSVEDLPPEAGAEKAILMATGVNSVLMVPVKHRDVIVGFIGFNTVGSGKKWTESDISLLSVVGDILINAIERRRMEQFLMDSKEYIRNILDSQEDIVIMTDGKNLQYVNKRFLDFEGLGSLEEFRQDHKCLCDLFIKVEGFVHKKDSDDCIDPEVSEKGEGFKVKMFDVRKGMDRVFLGNTKRLPGEEKLYVISFRDITDIEDESRRFEYLSVTDSLTGIYNRLKFDNALESEIQRAKRFERVFSLVLFDIDQFKDVNDTFGHDAGDEFLKTLTRTLAKHIRTTDTFARWGGDEFAVLVVETPIEGAMVLAEKLRKETEITNFAFGKVTCSFGVTEFKETDDLASIIKRVDEALYEAKKSGRDRICVR